MKKNLDRFDFFFKKIWSHILTAIYFQKNHKYLSPTNISGYIAITEMNKYLIMNKKITTEKKNKNKTPLKYKMKA